MVKRFATISVLVFFALCASAGNKNAKFRKAIADAERAKP
jgi:hypothetical protein